LVWQLPLDRLAKLTNNVFQFQLLTFNVRSTAMAEEPNFTFYSKAADGIRTHDLVLTKDALYQLSHSSKQNIKTDASM
jgi:hypothetical protein